MEEVKMDVEEEEECCEMEVGDGCVWWRCVRLNSRRHFIM